jgi:hypothetical protein
MRETGTGQQVAQLHDRYMMMMMMDGMNKRLHAKQTDREQRSNRFTKEREPQITERNLRVL